MTGCLDFFADADILSDMRTFTVREIDRQPSAMLDAADRDGAVEIRRRDGRVYAVQPKPAAKRITALPDFAARRRAIFPRMIPAAQVRKVDKLIRGE